MQQTFNTVNVNKRAVRHDFLHDTGKLRALFVRFLHVFHFRFAMNFEHRFTTQNQTVFQTVHFQYFRLECCAHEERERAYETQIALGKRNKTAQRFNLDEKACFNRFNTFDFYRFIVSQCLFDDIPVCQPIQFDFGDVDRTIFFHRIGDLRFDCIADRQYILHGFRSRK